MLASEDDGGNSDIYLGMHFYLGGDDPNLMRLSCRGGMAMPFEAKPPSRAEINQSLGQLLSITP